jgi:hypothetical protein
MQYISAKEPEYANHLVDLLHILKLSSVVILQVAIWSILVRQER